MSKSDVYVLSHNKLDDLPPYDRQTSTASSQSDNTYEKLDLRSPDGKISDSNTVTGAPFRGMGKEELLLHSGKPFWRRLRMICISIVLIGWLALIITVVALVLIYPRCKSPEGRDWWQKEVLYRVYVRSFKDSNNDGIGDLNGLTSKLDYIKSLGVGGVSLSSIYMDDGIDTDSGVTDHKVVDPELGTMADFRNFVDAAHNKGLKVILDFIPNHTSDKHNWFMESQKSDMRNNTYRNYYVWTDSPTNWVSVYDDTAWNMSMMRQEYYLHQFLETQPDLNLRSSLVQQELQNILNYWLSAKVDGFYVRDSGFLFEDYDMRDERLKDNTAPTNLYSSFVHEYTYGLPEVIDMLSRWRDTANNYTNKVLLADINDDIQATMELYGRFKLDGVHLSLNRKFLDKRDQCNGACVKDYVDQWMKSLPNGRWANWMLGDDTSIRAASRFNESFIRGFYMVTMLLPGTSFIYYGDEINMEDIQMTSSRWSRARSMRSLMQWENATFGGFCNATCTPWIGIANNFQTKNVERQNSPESMLTYMKNLTALRQKSSFVHGDYHQALVDDFIFSFVREFDGEKGYLVAVNFGKSEAERDFTKYHATIAKKATVEQTTGSTSSLTMEEEVDTTKLKLPAHQGVVVSWDYVAKEL